MKLPPKVTELLNELLLVIAATVIGTLAEVFTNSQGQTITWGIMATAVGYRVLIAVVFKLQDWLQKNEPEAAPVTPAPQPEEANVKQA